MKGSEIIKRYEEWKKDPETIRKFTELMQRERERHSQYVKEFAQKLTDSLVLEFIKNEKEEE